MSCVPQCTVYVHVHTLNSYKHTHVHEICVQACMHMHNDIHERCTYIYRCMYINCTEALVIWVGVGATCVTHPGMSHLCPLMSHTHMHACVSTILAAERCVPTYIQMMRLGLQHSISFHNHVHINQGERQLDSASILPLLKGYPYMPGGCALDKSPQ